MNHINQGFESFKNQHLFYLLLSIGVCFSSYKIYNLNLSLMNSPCDCADATDCGLQAFNNFSTAESAYVNAITSITCANSVPTGFLDLMPYNLYTNGTTHEFCVTYTTPSNATRIAFRPAFVQEGTCLPLLNSAYNVFTTSCGSSNANPVGLDLDGGSHGFAHYDISPNTTYRLCHTVTQNGSLPGCQSTTCGEGQAEIFSGAFFVYPSVLCTPPTISSISTTDPTCPSFNNGVMTITSSGSNLEYSLNNGASYQASNSFNNLTGGTYNIIVRNTSTGCSVDDTAVLDSTIPTSNDNDSDGISDFCDLDDDNDGILDSDEVCHNTTWGTSPWAWTQAADNATISVTDIDVTIDISTTALGDLDALGGTGIDGPTGTTDYFGGINDLGLFFDPDANQGTSPVIINLSFSKPVADLSFLITDIDGGASSPGRQDKITILTNIGTPTISIVTSGTPTFSINGNEAENTNPVLTSSNDDLGTVIVEAPNGATEVTLIYEDVGGLDDPTVRGIGLFGDMQFCLDSDGDGIPNYLDLDSDNDFCPDAIEGGSNFTLANTQNDTLIGGIDTNGIPIIATSEGQTIGTSTGASLQASECTNCCIENCTDGVDNNGDGFIDCQDQQCIQNLIKNAGMEDTGTALFATTIEGSPAEPLPRNSISLPGWTMDFSCLSPPAPCPDGYLIDDSANNVNNPEGEHFIWLAKSGQCARQQFSIDLGVCYEISMDVAAWASPGPQSGTETNFSLSAMGGEINNGNGGALELLQIALPESTSWSNLNWQSLSYTWVPEVTTATNLNLFFSQAGGPSSTGLAIDNIIVKRTCCLSEICNDGVDNDLDGLIDNLDDDCCAAQAPVLMKKN